MKMRTSRSLILLSAFLLVFSGGMASITSGGDYLGKARMKNTPNDRAKGGQRGKRVGVESGQRRKENVLIILDASGSMWGQISLDGLNRNQDRRCKIEIAEKVLEEYVDDVDATKVNLGLRVFGQHRERGCRDSDLIIPVGPLDKEAFKGQMRTVRPGHLGKTPIAFSLRKALVDITTPSDMQRFLDSGEFSEGEKSIILITDGEGGCDSIEEVRGLEDDLRNLGVEIVRINVIELKMPKAMAGKDVGELGMQVDMEGHLKKISRSTEGQYIRIEAKPGMGIEEFERQLRKSMRVVAPTSARERILSLFHRCIGRINAFISAHMSATFIPSMILFSIFFVFAMKWFFGR
jgi:hypothetical protein